MLFGRERKRAELRDAKAALDQLRAEMDAMVDAHGSIPAARAVDFAAQLESLHSTIWRLKRELGEHG